MRMPIVPEQLIYPASKLYVDQMSQDVLCADVRMQRDKIMSHPDSWHHDVSWRALIPAKCPGWPHVVWQEYYYHSLQVTVA
jgi:hypothetical protein